MTTCLGADPPPPPFGGSPSPPWLCVLFLEGIVTETEEKLIKHKNINYNWVTSTTWSQTVELTFRYEDIKKTDNDVILQLEQ